MAIMLSEEFTKPRRPVNYLVHSSIFNHIKKLRPLRQFNIQSWDYNLAVGEQIFDMKFIYLTESRTFMLDLQQMSAYSFPWLVTPTLYMELSYFSILERFIEINNLLQYIQKVETKLGLTTSRVFIKIITFIRCIRGRFDLAGMFKEFIEQNIESVSKLPQFYYIVESNLVPWLQPAEVKHFEIPIDTSMYAVFPIILDHLSTMSRPSQLTIFDLISFKLAFHDFRNPWQTEHLNNEIDYHIKHAVQRETGQGKFEITRYAFERNLQPCKRAMEYFQREYKHLINIDVHNTKIQLIGIDNEDDVLSMVKSKCNVQFIIDGTGYERMNAKLFIGLCACKNIVSATLDTNFRWTNNLSEHDTINSHCQFDIDLIGANTFNFIEEFVTSLKTMSPHTSRITFLIRCNLKRYLILGELKVKNLEFNKIQIDGILLEDLNAIIKRAETARIQFTECRFENKPRNWELLNDCKSYILEITIVEDEETWPYLFEFLYRMLLKGNKKTFQFKSKILIMFDKANPETAIRLQDLKFSIDKLNSKLEMINVNNEITDLYYEKHPFLRSDCDYEFYQ